MDEKDWRLAEAKGQLGISLAGQGRDQEALPWVSAGLERFAEIFPTAGLTIRLQELEKRLKTSAP